jgi:hypothetical protein
LAGVTATGSTEKLEIGLEKAILSEFLKMSLSNAIKEEPFNPSVGTFDKCQRSNDRISASVGILTHPSADPAKAGCLQAKSFRFSNEMVDRRGT